MRSEDKELVRKMRRRHRKIRQKTGEGMKSEGAEDEIGKLEREREDTEMTKLKKMKKHEELT